MTDADLERLVERAVARQVAPLRRLLEALLPPPLEPRQAELLDALGDVAGSAPFSTAEALEWAENPRFERVRLRAAVRAVGATNAHGLGMTLAAIARRSVGRLPRLERVGAEGGVALWSVRLGD